MLNNLSPLILFQSSFEKNMPDVMVKNAIHLNDDQLIVGDHTINIESGINILAYGKASLLMYDAARQVIAKNLFRKGLVVTHDNNAQIQLNKNENIIFSSHPFITSLSLDAGKKAKEFVKAGEKNDVLLVLISGGGSAMMALPSDTINLKDKIEFITNVMHMSVPEREVNILKKSLSKIKGGRLAESSRGNIIINCILSDERNHDISAISSGMTVCNRSINPIEVMDKYSLWDIAQKNIKSAILKVGEQKDIGCNKNIINHLVGSRENLINSMIEDSKDYGFDGAHSISNLHSCTPEYAADYLIKEFLKIYNSSKPGRHLIISTGEIQVKVEKFSNAKGGRNQHLVALFMMKFKPAFDFYFAAIATDGMDYLSGIHGAFYNFSMKSKIDENRDFIKTKIDERNTYEIHKKFGTLLKGPLSGSNISDFFLFSFNKT